MPSRHYSAYIIGLFPSIYDWTVNVSGRAPLLAQDGLYNSTYPPGSAGFIGVLAWKRGSLLVSMIWTAVVVMVLDRRWLTAAIWAFVGSLFAVFGIIHVPQAGFKNFAQPTWEQCSGITDAGVPTCWENAEQWMFFVAYLMLCATFGLIHLARRFDSSMLEELDDPSNHAFDDWFADAAKPADTFDPSHLGFRPEPEDSPEKKELEESSEADDEEKAKEDV